MPLRYTYEPLKVDEKTKARLIALTRQLSARPASTRVVLLMLAVLVAAILGDTPIHAY